MWAYSVQQQQQKRDFKMNDEQFLKIFATHSPYKRHKVGVMP